MVLITYDVDTTTGEGRKRLRKISKICCNYGIRVQNSVFECSLDRTQLTFVRAEILSIMDESKDNIRIYHLGNNYNTKIENYGVTSAFNQEDVLLL